MLAQSFTFLIAALAVYRISRMLAVEEGPFKVFTTLREWPPHDSWVARGLECPLCVSFWVALPIALWCGDWLWWPALSATTVLLWKWEGKR